MCKTFLYVPKPPVPPFGVQSQSTQRSRQCVLDIGFRNRQIFSSSWMCALNGKYLEKVELTRHGRNLVCGPAAAGLSWSKIFKQKKRQCDMSDPTKKNTKLSINWEFNEFSIQLYYNRSARDYHDISFTNSTYFIH